MSGSGSAAMENWQSEFLLLTFVVLMAFFIHRGSHESRDSDDEMKAMLQRIEQRPEPLTRRVPRPQNGSRVTVAADRLTGRRR